MWFAPRRCFTPRDPPDYMVVRVRAGPRCDGGGSCQQTLSSEPRAPPLHANAWKSGAGARMASSHIVETLQPLVRSTAIVPYIRNIGEGCRSSPGDFKGITSTLCGRFAFRLYSAWSISYAVLHFGQCSSQRLRVRYLCHPPSRGKISFNRSIRTSLLQDRG